MLDLDTLDKKYGIDLNVIQGIDINYKNQSVSKLSRLIRAFESLMTDRHRLRA